MYARSEATRLLCAGVHLDAGYRRRVIEELVEHEERSVAPSLGVDVVPVLAHALRSRLEEVRTALWLLAGWAAFFVFDLTGAGKDDGGSGSSGYGAGYGSGSPYDQGGFFGPGGGGGGGETMSGTDAAAMIPGLWAMWWALVCVLLWAGRSAAGGGSTSVYTVDDATLRRTAGDSRAPTALVWSGRLLAVGYWAAALVTLFQGAGNWAAVVFPLLFVLPVLVHRSRVAAVMRGELARDVFSTLPRAEPPDGLRYRRIRDAVDREQHAALTIYSAFRPFIGVGRPYGGWSFAVELQRRDGAGKPPQEAGTLTSRMIIDLVRPRLEGLRAAAAETSRDRLKDLEVQEIVYLPIGPPRSHVHPPETVRQHLADSVDEGGEGRRHFLLVRVGAWDEQVVVSVLVRVHTQGGMLVLEVVPHVLTPVRPLYQAVDLLADQEPGPWRDGVRALLASPSSGFAAAVSACATAIGSFRTWLNDPASAPPDGPERSVRELGSTALISLFQEMDISRYVKTIEDRIASGVRQAMREQGFRTDEFEQHITQVGEGAVHIGTMSGGAVAVGSGAQASG